MSRPSHARRRRPPRRRSNRSHTAPHILTPTASNTSAVTTPQQADIPTIDPEDIIFDNNSDSENPPRSSALRQERSSEELLNVLQVTLQELRERSQQISNLSQLPRLRAQLHDISQQFSRLHRPARIRSSAPAARGIMDHPNRAATNPFPLPPDPRATHPGYINNPLGVTTHNPGGLSNVEYQEILTQQRLARDAQDRRERQEARWGGAAELGASLQRRRLEQEERQRGGMASVFGTREEVERQGADYQSPLSTLFRWDHNAERQPESAREGLSGERIGGNSFQNHPSGTQPPRTTNRPSARPSGLSTMFSQAAAPGPWPGDTQNLTRDIGPAIRASVQANTSHADLTRSYSVAAQDQTGAPRITGFVRANSGPSDSDDEEPRVQYSNIRAIDVDIALPPDHDAYRYISENINMGRPLEDLYQIQRGQPRVSAGEMSHARLYDALTERNRAAFEHHEATAFPYARPARRLSPPPPNLDRDHTRPEPADESAKLVHMECKICFSQVATVVVLPCGRKRSISLSL